jgi:hypothetical protein
MAKQGADRSMYDGYRWAVYTDQTGRAALTPRQARRFAKKRLRRDKRLFGLGS